MNYTYYRRYQNPNRRGKRTQFSTFFWMGVILVVIALVLKACVAVVSSFSDEKKDDIILSVERGGGEVLSFGQSTWTTASDLGVILEGDSVQSDDNSYLLLTIHDGPVIRMDANSYVSFDRVEIDENDITTIHLVLHDGRIWYENDQDSVSSVVIHTDVMDVKGGDQYLLSNLSDNESLYVFNGTVNVDYVDRGFDELVLESLTFPAMTKSLITNELELALLGREAVVLSEKMEEGELSANEFVKWSLGLDRVIEIEPVDEPVEDPVVDDEVEDDEVDEPVEEAEEAVEETENLSISITSPASGTSNSDGAIAIEGVINIGTAASVYVTWSGNGQSYPLGLFQAGEVSFRYVADAQYANFASGDNTYSITAYDEDGNASNTVSVKIIGDF